MPTTADAPKHVVRHVDEVHRAALAAGDAGRLAVKFGKQAAQRTALGEICGVTAIGRRHHIVRAQHVANADRDRFLADRQMHRAFDLVGRIDARDFFFGAANEPQRAVNPLEIRSCQAEPADRPRALASNHLFRLCALAGQDFYPIAVARCSYGERQAESRLSPSALFRASELAGGHSVVCADGYTRHGEVVLVDTYSAFSMRDVA